MRYLKYVIVSIFCVCVLTIISFAADSPIVATVNGYGYTSLSDALAVATSGDTVSVVSDTSFSSDLSIPSGVNFNLPYGVTLSTSNNSINSYGNLYLAGNIISSNRSEVGSLLYLFEGNSLFTGSIISNVSNVNGSAIHFPSSSSAVLDIINGTFIGYSSAINNSNSPGSSLIIHGGTFIPGISGSYTLANGSSVVPGETGTVISWGPLYQIGQLVSSAISWIVLFVTAIVSNKLLLIWLLVIFVGLGIGLIKRICRS